MDLKDRVLGMERRHGIEITFSPGLPILDGQLANVHARCPSHLVSLVRLSQLALADGSRSRILLRSARPRSSLARREGSRITVSTSPVLSPILHPIRTPPYSPCLCNFPLASPFPPRPPCPRRFHRLPLCPPLPLCALCGFTSPSLHIS